MNKIPYIVIGWLVSILVVGTIGYNKGVKNTQAKMELSITKQVSDNIKLHNDNLALVESINQANIKMVDQWNKQNFENWQAIDTPTTIIKYNNHCESNIISQQIINDINGEIK